MWQGAAELYEFDVSVFERLTPHSSHVRVVQQLSTHRIFGFSGFSDMET